MTIEDQNGVDRVDRSAQWPHFLNKETRSFFVAQRVPNMRLAPTLGEPVPSQSSGDTWIRVRGGRIQSVRNGHTLSRGKCVLLTYISNHSGGDPLVIAP